MLLCDYHTHSYFSYDGNKDASIDAICQSAIMRGVTHIAITDHFETNSKYEGNFAPLDDCAQYDAICSAKEKYAGRLHIAAGLEIGQANQYPEEAEKMLSRHNYDFIIASIHNLRGMPDFYYMDFRSLDTDKIEELFGKYIEELCELQDKFSRIDTVGHITYIHRYAAFAGKNIDFSKFYPALKGLFRKMVEKGTALEVNTSTLSRGLGFTLPDTDIIKLYYNCGGRLITVGSDAHTPEGVGAKISETMVTLKNIGFNEILCIENGKKTSKIF